MENAPIVFHPGRCKRFQIKKHVEEAFVGNEKASRYDSYRRYFEEIHRCYENGRDSCFQEAIEANLVVDSANSKTSPSNLVDMMAVIFYGTAAPDRGRFFELLVKEFKGSKRGFKVARLETGSAYFGVENVIEDVVQQAWDSPGDPRRLFPDAKNGKPTKVVVIIDNVASFGASVVEDFLFVLSLHESADLRFFVVAGFPELTSPNSVLSHRVLRKYNVEIMTVSLDDVVKRILNFVLSPDNDLQMSLEAFKLVALPVVEHSLSCDELLRGVRNSVLEYFRSCEQRATTRGRSKQTPISSSFPACWIMLKLLSYLQDPETISSSRASTPDCPSLDDLPRGIAHTLDDYESALDNLNKLEKDDILKILAACKEVLSQNGLGAALPLVEFEKAISSLENDFSNIDELQRRADEEAKRSASNKRRPADYNPNRSSKLVAEQGVLDDRKASAPKNVFSTKKRELREALNTFFEELLRYPSNRFLTDVTAFRRILLASQREELARALAADQFAAAFDFYEKSDAKLEIPTWFETFKSGFAARGRKRSKKDNAAILSAFYQFLAELEFVGFIRRSPKKDVVIKLCPTAALIQ